MKKIVFFCNYLNHHQMPLADAFYELLGDDYAFVATMPVEAEHLKGGGRLLIPKLLHLSLSG